MCRYSTALQLHIWMSYHRESLLNSVLAPHIGLSHAGRTGPVYVITSPRSLICSVIYRVSHGPQVYETRTVSLKYAMIVRIVFVCAFVQCTYMYNVANVAVVKRKNVLRFRTYHIHHIYIHIYINWKLYTLLLLLNSILLYLKCL